jgi:hypothetical protein
MRSLERTITLAKAVEEVLCFSGIDRKQSGGDEATFVLKFSLRNHAVFGLKLID